MKAILVLDEMPKCCDECQLNYDMGVDCDALPMISKTPVDKRGMHNEEKRPSWCPLKEMPYNYEDAFKVACELLNGDMTGGVDKYYIFEHMMKKNGVVSCKSYEEYILEHLDQLAMWRWEDEDD